MNFSKVLTPVVRAGGKTLPGRGFGSLAMKKIEKGAEKALVMAKAERVWICASVCKEDEEVRACVREWRKKEISRFSFPFSNRSRAPSPSGLHAPQVSGTQPPRLFFR